MRERVQVLLILPDIKPRFTIHRRMKDRTLYLEKRAALVAAAWTFAKY